MTLVEILQGANVALHLITVRLVLVITLLLTFALFCWAMYLQTQLGAIIAAAWAGLVFLPVLLTGGRRHGITEQAKHEHTEETGSGAAPGAARRAA